MAAAVFTYNLDNADRIQLGGNQWLVTGEITSDTGDYAAGGVAIAASSLNADTIDRLIVGKTSIIKTSAYWIKSTGKLKIFLEDVISGIEAEHAASALTAQSIPFIAVVRKAA
jgi:hypothetical protein